MKIEILAKWSNKIPASYLSTPPDERWWELACDARVHAEKLHESQFRTSSSTPYFHHLAEVALIIGIYRAMGLIQEADFKSTLEAAWLHDATEDQNLAIDEISQKYSKNTANLVDAMTKRKHTQSPMQDSLERLLSVGKNACLLKLADRTSNLSSPPPEIWDSKKIRKYGQEGRYIVATLNDKIPSEAALALEATADEYLKRFGGLGLPSQHRNKH